MPRRLLASGSWFVAYFVFSVSCGFTADPFVIVLGTAQDGGFPQAGCQRECCDSAWHNTEQRCFVSCVALVDPDSGQRWMFDCTPDFPEQLRLLDQFAPPQGRLLLAGILPTHAHVGHYTGLIHFGREVLGTSKVPVFTMPRMKYFLETNGPWSQLVALQQIQLHRTAAGQPVPLNHRLTATPFLVPHRDEFSETVGFRIAGPEKSLVYLPDIDKWERWEVDIESVISNSDFALLDGTFYSADELPGRDMSEIPHPFIHESIQRFETLAPTERAKVHFIHLNHTNPLLQPRSEELQQVERSGMSVAKQGEKFSL